MLSKIRRRYVIILAFSVDNLCAGGFGIVKLVKYAPGSNKEHSSPEPSELTTSASESNSARSEEI